MKRIILIMLFMLASSTFAQDSKYNVGLQFGFINPIGDFGKKPTRDSGLNGGYAGAGFMGGLNLNYKVNENFEAGIEFGYLSFGDNSIKEEDDYYEYKETISNSMIPILLTGRYFFSNQQMRPYGSIGVGVSKVFIVSTSREYYDGDLEDKWEYSAKEIIPTFNIGAGFLYKINDKIYLDVGVKYNHVMTSGSKFEFEDDDGDTGKVKLKYNSSHIDACVGMKIEF